MNLIGLRQSYQSFLAFILENKHGVYFPGYGPGDQVGGAAASALGFAWLFAVALGGSGRCGGRFSFFPQSECQKEMASTFMAKADELETISKGG